MCFLESIENQYSTFYQDFGFWSNGYYEPVHGYTGDYVKIAPVGLHWYLQTYSPPSGSPWYHPHAIFQVKSRCFVAPHNLGSWLYLASVGGSYSGALTSVSGATCGLTGIGGSLLTNAWTNGGYISSSNGQFFLNVADGKAAWATCMQ